MLKAEGNNYLLPIAIIIHVAAISTGLVNVNVLRKYLERISIIAALCVITQQLFHVLFGYHIPMMVPSFLISDLKDYTTNIITGCGEVETMYRPCAFFLEPSHFSQYVVYGLGSSLFKSNSHIKEAIIISIGLVCTTSGMGFILTFAVWGWWFLTYRNRVKKGISVKNVLILVLLVSVILIIMMKIPFFSQIISRFTNDGTSDYNAVNGRLIFWSKIIENQSINSLFWGYGDIALDEDIYYTGFMKILYAYGIIGTAFFYLFWLYLLIKVNTFARTFVISYIGLSFLANLTGFISLIFNIGVILVFDTVNNNNKSR